MLIRNVAALLGPSLDYSQDTCIRIRNGRIESIGSELRPRGREKSVDCSGLLAIPGFVNAHTHIGDSIGKDVTLDGSVDQKIHPMHGVKSKILKNTPPDILSEFMAGTCRSMIRRGITTFVDFREGGLAGVVLLKRALRGVPIRAVILGRVDFYQDARDVGGNALLPDSKARELAALVDQCDGIGISGANEYSTAVLRQYSRTPKIRAIHSSETRQSISMSERITGTAETVRALDLEPHFLVHMTHAPRGDLEIASKKTRGIVVCPRANSALAEGIPDIGMMHEAGCMLALGTDNVMINSPDMFREMDFLWKATMGIQQRRVDPREILKMATVNGGMILGRNVGAIADGMMADCIFLDTHMIDLEPMHNPYASVVHRASESAIRGVMIGGRMVHGSI